MGAGEACNKDKQREKESVGGTISTGKSDMTFNF